ncbi:MAG: ABC transporter ATP-binding protein [Methanobacteriota archaeon]|nr:MAG: ABC transporter ATP-binding protein [Euryarchaeota archaeon]
MAGKSEMVPENGTPTLEVGRMVVSADPMALTIELQQLWKSYDGKPALQGLFFDARPGEIVGLIGPNGAGKTTTLKILVGLLRPDYGLVRVKGNDVLADPISYKADVGYMPEAPTLPEYLTPNEFLGYVGRIRNLPRDRIADRTRELLAILDLAPKADETIASLSKGMKAKVAFAAAILHEPSILVLDEPLIGIDPAGQHLLKERLAAMARAGATVLVSTHQLDTAERLCGRVAIVNHGRNVATGDLAALRAQAHTGAEGSLEDVFLRLTQEAVAPAIEPPRPRGWFRRG